MSYQPGQVDAYYHRYAYDGENRLTEVYSGRDSVMLFLFPEREAKYSYYKHGPLARTELGQLRVQGVDYAYTLQGWLKGVNSTAVNDGSFDMGGDGKTSGNNSIAARDAFGFSVNYFVNDYKPVGTNNAFAGNTFTLTNADGGTAASPLYNGNIAAMLVNIPRLGSAMVYGYKYDQLNRLVSMDAFGGFNNTTNTFTAISQQDYKERLGYDPNGNILNYLRNGTGANLSLNNYSYGYAAGTNRLASISNSINAQTKTYSYDAIGNTTADGMQNMSNAVWNVYGKLQSATNKDGAGITYTYNTSGQRISKTVSDTTEWYVRDATGNLLSMYRKAGTGSLKQTELNIYGSSMLGKTGEQAVTPQNITLSGGFGNAAVSMFTRGEKEYLLTDHSGNTRVVLTDKKIQYSSNGTTIDYYETDVKTANYYSTYGAISKTSGAENSIAFNGQRKSTEIGANAQTAEFWEYNGDVGRRWNVDPKPATSISPFATFHNNPILYNDVLGDTSVVGAGGSMNIEIDETANSLEFYKSSDNVIKGTSTKTPSQAGQLKSFTNALGTFTARWTTDASGAAIFAGYLNDKNQSVETVVTELNKFASSKLGGFWLWASGLVEQDLKDYNNDPVGHNLKIGFTMVAMTMMADAEAGAFPTGRGYNPTRTTLDDMSGIGFVRSAPKFADGTFSIFNWQGYPIGAARPSGTFRLLDGSEYQQVRALANKTNAAIHKNNLYLKGLQIHEIVPVKFGGSPTLSSNKIYLTPAQHSEYTNFWNQIMRSTQTLK